MTKNKNSSQTFTLRVLRTQTTLITNVNNATLAAVSFALLLDEDIGKTYRLTHAYTDLTSDNILFDDSVYPFLRDGDEVSAVINNNSIKLVENLTLGKEILNHLNNRKKSR